MSKRYHINLPYRMIKELSRSCMWRTLNAPEELYEYEYWVQFVSTSSSIPMFILKKNTSEMIQQRSCGITMHLKYCIVKNHYRFWTRFLSVTSVTYSKQKQTESQIWQWKAYSLLIGLITVGKMFVHPIPTQPK